MYEKGTSQSVGNYSPTTFTITVVVKKEEVRISGLTACIGYKSRWLAILARHRRKKSLPSKRNEKMEGEMVLFEVANLLFIVLAAQAVPAYETDHQICESMQTCLATFTNTYTALCHSHNQNIEFGVSDCAQLDFHINGLKSSIEKICASTMDTENLPSPSYNPVVWKPLVPTTMGSIDVGVTTIQNFPLPSTVLHTATEVLIYVWIKVY